MDNKVAVVTGANQGIGYGIVRRICKEHPDWIVYGTSRNPANGEEACKKLQEEGYSARFVEADLTKPDTITALKEKLLKEHGGIDILINNAGIVLKRGAPDPPIVKVEVAMNTNVFGTHMVCEQLFPILKDGARVAILTSYCAMMGLHQLKDISPDRYQAFIKDDPPMDIDTVMKSMREFVDSVRAGDYAAKGWAKDESSFASKEWTDDTAYCISKLGNTLMARAYQHQFDSTAPERDIVVNAVNPGYVPTNMNEYASEAPHTVDDAADTAYYSATLPAQTQMRGVQIFQRNIFPWV